jgi:phosphomannomutase
MMEKSCCIGGEESGGYAFKQHIPERDGILSALFFLEALIIQKKKPSNLIAELQKIMGPHIFERADLNFPPNLRKKFELKIDQLSVDSIGGLKVVLEDRQDGIKLTMKDGSWLAIRMSGTEPLIRVYVESSDKTKIKKIFNDVFSKLRK